MECYKGDKFSKQTKSTKINPEDLLWRGKTLGPGSYFRNVQKISNASHAHIKFYSVVV